MPEVINTQEIWRDVVGYEGSYKVSNLGRVISLCRSYNSIKYMTHRTDSHGYIKVYLSMNKHHKGFLVHRLVAMAFIPNPENKPQVNHINGIKHDNRVENLEWCTNQENVKHAFLNGLSKPTYGGARLNNEQVLDIFNSFDSIKDIALKYGITNSCVCSIKSGNSWSNLTNKKYRKKELLTSEQVLDIFNSNESNKKLSKKHNTSVSNITAIKRGARWSIITGKKYEKRRI